MIVLLAAGAAALFSIGTYLVLQRKLSRIIIGIGLLTHGANVLFVLSGRRGIAPLIGSGSTDDFSDPLPQAMALTGIVISFGVTAFLLALAYRSWVLTDDDEVEDDLTDRLIARGGMADKEVADASEETEELRHDEGLVLLGADGGDGSGDEHPELSDLTEPIERGDVPS
jgi:multicomponent Na+:H+ antiporter subunit C